MAKGVKNMDLQLIICSCISFDVLFVLLIG